MLPFFVNLALMSIERVFLSIQQHIPKHPLLLQQLVVALQKAPAQFEKLIAQLKQSESSRLRLKQYIERVFLHKDISYCLIESGISNRTGFVSEIFRKLKHKVLPETSSISTFHETLFRISDFNHLSVEQLEKLLAELQITVNFDQSFLKKEIIDAIEVLSYRITAAAIESEFISRFKDNQTVNSFIRQNKEIHALIAQHVLGVPFNMHLVSHIKNLLNESMHDLSKLQRASKQQGVSLQLSYALHRTAQQIERLKTLLDLHSNPKVDAHQLASFIKQICVNEQRKNSIRSLLNDTIYLLAHQISEHESKTGEHYIADTRKEYTAMFFSSCVGGVVAVWMTLIKFFLHKIPFAPFWQSFAYSINYATGFVGIQVMHGTLATKQPSMTAAKIAHSLDTKDSTTQQSIKGLALMIAKVSRSQFISFVGNLIIVFPLAALIAWIWQISVGTPLVDEKTAQHMLHDVHPFASPTWFYASITGVMLFISGIISGYYDNKVVYSHIPARLRRNKVLQKVLTKRGLIRFTIYIENNMGSLVGNISLGFFLGMAGFVGFIFGIPFDIRHITISSGNYAIAIVSLLHVVHLKYALICLLGVLGIGVFNFLISFILALFVAIRSRKVQFKEVKKLILITFTYFRKHPSDFFFAPKQERSELDF